MSKSYRFRAALIAGAVPAVVAAGLITQTVLAGSAGAVTATKVQLKNGQLSVEGNAAPGSSFVSVESTTSAISARPDVQGRFKAQATGFTAPDCKLTIRDFSPSPALTVTIPNCTPSVTPVPRTPAAPSGSCVITPQSPATLTAGAQSVFWFHATGCNPSGPLSYSVVAGAIPTGMSVGTFQNSSSGNIIGTPSVRGSYTFTVQVTDAGGATDQENFTVNVV